MASLGGGGPEAGKDGGEAGVVDAVPLRPVPRPAGPPTQISGDSTKGGLGADSVRADEGDQVGGEQGGVGLRLRKRHPQLSVRPLAMAQNRALDRGRRIPPAGDRAFDSPPVSQFAGGAKRRPRHHLAVHVVLGIAPYLPDSVIRKRPVPNGRLSQVRYPPQKFMRAVVDSIQITSEPGRLPQRVQLDLPRGAVTDPHQGPRISPQLARHVLEGEVGAREGGPGTARAPRRALPRLVSRDGRQAWLRRAWTAAGRRSARSCWPNSGHWRSRRSSQLGSDRGSTARSAPSPAVRRSWQPGSRAR